MSISSVSQRLCCTDSRVERGLVSEPFVIVVSHAFYCEARLDLMQLRNTLVSLLLHWKLKAPPNLMHNGNINFSTKVHPRQYWIDVHFS